MRVFGFTLAWHGSARTSSGNVTVRHEYAIDDSFGDAPDGSCGIMIQPSALATPGSANYRPNPYQAIADATEQ